MRLIILLLLTVCAVSQAFLLQSGDQGKEGIHYDAKLARDWSQGYVTFGKFNKFPLVESDAKSANWVLNNTGGSGVDGCNNGLWQGRRYVLGGDVSTMLLFDNLGHLAGFQLSATQTPRGSIPPWEKIGGVYTLTTYYRDPSTICTNNPSGGNNAVGDRLWLKTSSSTFLAVPLLQSQATNGTLWVHGKCFWTMGDHYWWNISNNINCNDFFPLFLLYNGGILNGYGFAFFGNEPSPRYEHPGGSVLKMFFQDQTMPQCVLNEKFLSTIHVYFNSPYLNFC